jgi:hypothetical protein
MRSGGYIPAFQRNLLLPSSEQKTEATGSTHVFAALLPSLMQNLMKVHYSFNLLFSDTT